jgi:hypothetical protein
MLSPMSTDPALLAGYKPKPPASRQPEPGELLFEFVIGHDRYRCELRDHGERYGVEAQFLLNGDLERARTFATWMGLTLTPREHAVQWAEQEREALERGG